MAKEENLVLNSIKIYAGILGVIVFLAGIYMFIASFIYLGVFYNTIQLFLIVFLTCLFGGIFFLSAIKFNSYKWARNFVIIGMIIFFILGVFLISKYHYDYLTNLLIINGILSLLSALYLIFNKNARGDKRK